MRTPAEAFTEKLVHVHVLIPILVIVMSENFLDAYNRHAKVSQRLFNSSDTSDRLVVDQHVLLHLSKANDVEGCLFKRYVLNARVVS